MIYRCTCKIADYLTPIRSVCNYTPLRLIHLKQTAQFTHNIRWNHLTVRLLDLSHNNNRYHWFGLDFCQIPDPCSTLTFECFLSDHVNDIASDGFFGNSMCSLLSGCSYENKGLLSLNVNAS